MTAYWQIEEETYEDDWEEPGLESWEWQDPGAVDGAPDLPWPFLLGAILLVFWFLASSGPTTTWRSRDAPVASLSPANPAQAVEVVEIPPVVEAPDPHAFGAPYRDYVITQGIHGQSYGHMAVDLAAGKGAPVLSPIHGTVKAVYTDQWGNPTLVIENEIYEVKILHGIYSVSEGDTVRLGDPVGEESNLGYTTDMRGVPCKGRTDYCGYHTHLNVYDRIQGVNVNPLDLIRGGE